METGVRLSQSLNVGFIGLGIMGKPMARNLLNAGFEVAVWNRTASRMDELVNEGARASGSPQEAAQGKDIVITIVTDSPDVEAVVLGEQGIIHGAKPGAVVVDMSTISPEVTRSIAERLKERGIDMLDAPVSGGDKGAIEGTLSIMVGGEESVFERAMPVFRAMGKTITHVGPNGAGQTVKLCNQITGALNILAVSEAVVFAAKSGVDLSKMLQAIGGGAASSWMVQNLGPRMVKGDFEPGFMVKLQQKDLRLALEAARDMHLPLPAASLVHQLFAAVEAEGMGDKGTQALVTALERLGNVEARQEN
ncbi:MAG: 2-hydroxy-3-oxopropionate reductase [Armatimonadetes bacterium]|nr:2-hydroxy-3-oxopropionate reductase [Armatimonadota bacterium]